MLELTDGGVDHAFEVVGRPETMRFAWDVLRPGGTAVVGLAGRGVEVSLPAIDLSEKGIKGCYDGSGGVAAELPGLVAVGAAGRIELEDVVSHFVDLEGIDDAFARLSAGEGARSIVIVDSELADAREAAQQYPSAGAGSSAGRAGDF
jgi:S-(hydroxymethyl)glutathione dehydrogenase/alcohol dehydrogenase